MGAIEEAQSDQEGRFYKGQGAVQAHCLNCSMGAPFVLLHVRADPHCFADYEACGLQSRPLQHCMLRPDKHYSCEISASTASTPCNIAPDEQVSLAETRTAPWSGTM